MSIKKVIKQIHLWLGLASGLVIFIVSITGAIYVFSDDITNLTDKHLRFVTAEQKSILPASDLKQIADKELIAFYGKKPADYWDWKTLSITNINNKAVMYSARRYENPDLSIEVYVNPYTGKLLGIKNNDDFVFWKTIVALHTNLLLGEIGSTIVRYATLIFLVMMVSGIILWWPKNKSAAKQRFSFRWKEGIKWRRKNYDLHNILGFYMSWILLFVVITGLSWSFEWFKNGIIFVLDGEISMTKEIVYKSATNSVKEDLFVDKIMTKSKALFPKAYSYDLVFPTKKDKPIEVYVKETINWSPGNYLYFDPETANLLAQNNYSDKTAGQKFDELTGDIHYGWIFGWSTKIAVFLGCLVAASLPITGFYIWWGRKKKNKNKNK